MRRCWSLSVTAALTLVGSSLVLARQGHQHGSGNADAPHSQSPKGDAQALTLHGGRIVTAGEFVFEVVFLRDAVQIHLYDQNRKPVSVGTATAEATVTIPAKDVQRVPLSRKVADGAAGQGATDWLEAKVDLAAVREDRARAEFRVRGLPGQNEKDVAFSQPFHLAHLVGFACANHPDVVQDRPGTCPKGDGDLTRVTYHYTCPMHPGVVERDAKARCPDCGMRLQEKVDAASKPSTSTGADAPQKPHKHGGCCGG